MNAHTGAGGSASGTTLREDALVSRLSTLAPALDGEPDPEWQARTRARLVAMTAVRTPEPAPASPLRRLFSRATETRSAWRSRLAAGVAGVAAAVTGLATVVALSADARPGDALYGVKRGTEQTQLALAGDARGRTLLAFATNRLEELAVVLESRPSAQVVEETLATMDAQTLEGAAWMAGRAVEIGSRAPLDDLSSWSAGQSAALDGLLGDVPEDARAEAADSATLLGAVEKRVAELRTVFGCAGGPATAGSDELGPRPGGCAAPVESPVDGGAPGGPAPQAPTDGVLGTAAPPADGTPGSGTGTGPDGEPGTGSASDGGPGTGTDGRRLPTPEAPGTPGLPTPDLPTSFPGPEGTVRPPLGGASAPATTAPRLPLPTSVEELTCTVPLVPDC